MQRPADDDSSWPALLFFANEVALAYRRQNAKLRETIAERDRAIEFYRKQLSQPQEASMHPCRKPP